MYYLRLIDIQFTTYNCYVRLIDVQFTTYSFTIYDLYMYNLRLIQSTLVTTAFVTTAFRDPAAFYSKPTEMLYFTTRYNGNLMFRHRQCNPGPQRVYLSAFDVRYTGNSGQSRGLRHSIVSQVSSHSSAGLVSVGCTTHPTAPSPAVV